MTTGNQNLSSRYMTRIMLRRCPHVFLTLFRARVLDRASEKKIIIIEYGQGTQKKGWASWVVAKI
jgi:hypothetical protein